jgi:8-oxo-dGTP pyrophosphatase MutT (NUDIX family)
MAKIETVRTVIHDAHYNVLMGQRRFNSNIRAGQLDLFGGRVDDGEPLEVAARREVREETGFDLADRPIRPLYIGRDEDAGNTYVRHYFSAQIERFPREMLTEHIGSVLMPLVIAASSMQFEHHREALSRLLG